MQTKISPYKKPVGAPALQESCVSNSSEEKRIISKASKLISRLTLTGLIYWLLKLKYKKKDPFEISWIFDQVFLVAAISVIAFLFIGEWNTWDLKDAYSYLLIIPISRCIEIPFGFFSDLIDKAINNFDSQKPGTGKRVALSILVYFESILNYALLYHTIPQEQWLYRDNHLSLSMLDSLYFSVITISTTGYGDITPAGVMSRLATIGEITTSLLIIALSFAIYVGSKK